MAVPKPRASLLLLAFAIATLAAVGYVSCQTTDEAVQDSRASGMQAGVHARRLLSLRERGRQTGARGHRLLYQSVDSIEPRQAHTFFSRASADQVKTFSLSGNKHFGESLHDSFASRVSAPQVGEERDYGPPSVNPPIHVDPPAAPPLSFNSVHQTLNRQLDTSTNIHEDYAPAGTHPPIDYHDYPPPADFNARQKTWSSEASFMHATLPPPTIIYHPENLSGG